MRRGTAISERVHTGQSEAIHSPEAWASTVVSDTVWMSWSMTVVCNVAISCCPNTLRTMSRPLESDAYRKGRPGSSGRLPGRVPVNDFSGLVSSICALAKAAARAAIDSLDRCIARLHRVDYLEADRTRLGALAPHTMAERLLGILGHQALELG